MRALMMLGAASMDLAHGCDADDPRSTRANLLIPIIKGWMTERALDVTSQAVQVHGGMGFIEETGAAQHFRDARILPIYEGTTAIQANDLVFRKTLRDGGAAVGELFDEINAEMQQLAAHDDDIVAANAGHMTRAVEAARKATAHILAAANEPRRPAVNGVNYLMLLGRLCGGWMMTRASYKAALQKYDASADPSFMQAKLVTAGVFMTHHLPQVHALADVIMTGDNAVLAMDTDWL